MCGYLALLAVGGGVSWPVIIKNPVEATLAAAGPRNVVIAP